MRIRRMAIGACCVGLVLCGCDEPPSGLVPVTPPGANIPRVSPDADPAQALGETVPTAIASTPPASRLADMKLAPPTAKGETKTTAGGVKYETLKEGSGPELQAGQKAKIHYEGKLEDGTVFDASRSHQPPDPLSVSIGVSSLIKGWEEGIPGMKVGEVRKLTIPPQLAYGKNGQKPKIPGDATLIFQVELVGID